MRDFTLYVGILSGVLTSASMVPQLVKIIREKKAEAISYFMLCMLLAGVASWVWYGILKKDYPIIITNLFSFLVNTLIVIFSYRYKTSSK